MAHGTSALPAAVGGGASRCAGRAVCCCRCGGEQKEEVRHVSRPASTSDSCRLQLHPLPSAHIARCSAADESLCGWSVRAATDAAPLEEAGTPRCQGDGRFRRLPLTITHLCCRTLTWPLRLSDHHRRPRSEPPIRPSLSLFTPRHLLARRCRSHRRPNARACRNAHSTRTRQGRCCRCLLLLDSSLTALAAGVALAAAVHPCPRPAARRRAPPSRPRILHCSTVSDPSIG